MALYMIRRVHTTLQKRLFRLYRAAIAAQRAGSATGAARHTYMKQMQSGGKSPPLVVVRRKKLSSNYIALAHDRPTFLAVQTALNIAHWQCLTELSAVGNDDGRTGGSRLGADSLDGLDDVHAAGDSAVDDVLAVEPVGLDGAEEELGAVGAGAGVGHGEDSGAGVLELEVLVSELLAVDGLASGAVAAGEVAALAHELGDDAVERGSLEVERLAGLADALLAGAQAAEVLDSLGDNVGAKGHLDAASGLATDGHWGVLESAPCGVHHA